MIVDAEAVSGVDTDVGIVVAGGEVGAHDPGALLEGEGVPGPLLRHGIDHHVGLVTDRSRCSSAVLLAGVLVLAEVLALPPRGEVAVGTGAVGPQARRGEAGLGVPEGVGVVAHQPEEQVGVRAGADERVGMRGDTGSGERGGEFVFLLFALVSVETPPLRRDRKGEEAIELVHPAASSGVSR